METKEWQFTDVEMEISEEVYLVIKRYMDIQNEEIHPRIILEASYNPKTGIAKMRLKELRNYPSLL